MSLSNKSPTGLSLPVSSTDDLFGTLCPATSTASTNCISLLAEDSGRSQPEWPAGQTTSRSGPAPVRARRKVSPAKDLAPPIQGICGLTFEDSSVPDGPLSSWENRLRQRLGRIGSTERCLIWTMTYTPQGRCVSQLAPSMRLTKEVASIGSQLQTMWPTATRDWRSDRSKLSSAEMYGTKGRPLSRTMLEVAGEISFNPTPTVADVQGGRKARSGARSSEPLLNGLLAAYDAPSMWLTPRVGETTDQASRTGYFNCLSNQMSRTGPITNGSSAPSTAKRGAPNPEFPFWLMGFPDEWISGALAAMQSFRKSRQKSSKRTSKPKITIEPPPWGSIK